jgi:hypothetical protein
MVLNAYAKTTTHGKYCHKTFGALSKIASDLKPSKLAYPEIKMDHQKSDDN